jgi:hypothetical protein
MHEESRNATMKPGSSIDANVVTNAVYCPDVKKRSSAGRVMIAPL